jgi:hypothetical protein
MAALGNRGNISLSSVLISYRDLSAYAVKHAQPCHEAVNRRRLASGYIFSSKRIRAGVENGSSSFDLSGNKVYDLKGGQHLSSLRRFGRQPE